MTDTAVDTPRIDLLDPASFAHGQPHDQFRWLRRHDPVYHHSGPDGADFWAVTRYHDVRAVGRDHETFSSWAKGIHVGDPPPEALEGVRNMMLFMDPPQHRRYRMLVARGFTPPAAERLRPRVEELASQIVDRVADRGECDLVTDIAGELPSYVIAELMGIPLDDGRKLYDLTEKMHAAPEAVPEDERMAAALEMLLYAASVAQDKRQCPADDLASLLVDSEGEGEQLKPEEFNWFFLLLVNAGGDTTRNLVAGGMQALFDHPDQRRRLQGDLDGLLPTAVEEMLRYVSPVVYMRRTATRDVELGGKQITAGDAVCMYYGSANRDDDVFADPDRFDVGRPVDSATPPVAFGGGGPHFCLGAHIARAEIAAMLREILTRLPDIEPAGDAEWLPSNFISGPRHLPVRFTPPRA